MNVRRRVDNGGVRLLSAEEMDAWCNLNCIDDQDRYEAVTYYWPAMETVFMEYHERYKPRTHNPGGTSGGLTKPTLPPPRRPTARRR